MLKALNDTIAPEINGFMSFEERMGCGAEPRRDRVRRAASSERASVLRHGAAVHGSGNRSAVRSHRDSRQER